MAPAAYEVIFYDLKIHLELAVFAYLETRRVKNFFIVCLSKQNVVLTEI